MTSKERDFCTILDKLIDIKGQRDLLILLHELCLTNLLSSSMGRRTFLIPPSSAVNKLKKAKAADAKEQIRRHILNKLIDDKSFKKDEPTINVGTMVKNNRYNIKVGKKDEIVVDGVKCKLVARARNGVIYQADDVLKENIVAQEPKSRSSSRSSRSSRKSRGSSSQSRSRSRTPKSRRRRGARRRTQKGGSYFPLVQNNYKTEYDGSLESRLLFIQQYEDMFKNKWAHHGLGHLLLYLNENVGDLKHNYVPFLGSNPTTSLELLLGLYDRPWNPSRLLVDENQFAGFANSSYFLNGNQALMFEAQELINSFLLTGGIGDCAYESPSVDMNFVNQSRGYLSNILKQNPIHLADNIQSIYKIMVGEPNRFNPGHMRVFEKVWEDPAEGLLKNDLIRFSGNTYDMSIPFEHRYQQMSTMFSGSSRDVISRIFNRDILTNYTGNRTNGLDGLGGLASLDLGGLSRSTDTENLLDYIGLWVDSNDFAHSFQVDMSQNNGSSMFSGMGGLGGLNSLNSLNSLGSAGYNFGAPTTTLNYSSTSTPFSSNTVLSGNSHMRIGAPSLTKFGTM